MNKFVRPFLLALLVANLTGCAGLFVAGAATTVYAVTDPRTSKELLTDNDISLQAGAIGNKSPYQFNVRVSAATFRGNVLLMGQAVNQEYKDKITTEVSKIKGVKNIYNQMKVKPLLSIGAISNDVWITTKVKSALVGNSQLKDVKVSVYTEDAEVFLVGAVSPEHADIAVDIARNISGVKKVMKAFYYGENDAQQTTATSTEGNKAPAEELSDTQPVKVKQESNNNSDAEVVPYIEPIEDDSLTEEDL